MAATIDATVGGASSNSYSTLAAANTYFEERLNASAWTSASTDEKNRALIQATRRLDQEKYQGEQVTTGQALKWPRAYATDDDGYEFGTSIIPVIVKHAMYELALRFLNDDTTDTLADTGLEPFESVAVGSLEVTPRAGFQAGELPENVQRLLRPVLVTPGLSGRLMRS